jgi:hypothetical protein
MVTFVTKITNEPIIAVATFVIVTTSFTLIGFIAAAAKRKRRSYSVCNKSEARSLSLT